MKKFVVAFMGIVVAILVAFACVNVYKSNGFVDPIKEEVESVEELDDLAVEYANAHFGYDGKVASAKLIGVTDDVNYVGGRVDVEFYNANGNVIGGAAISRTSLVNAAN